MEARERVQGALRGLHVAWVRLARDRPSPGALPDAQLEAPRRDPGHLEKDHVVHAYRDLYRSLDLDPTTTPPKGEALARRLARGDTLPQEPPIEAAIARASALTRVPLHVHDEDRIEPPLTVTRSDGATRLDPERSQPDPLPEGAPMITDARGPIAMLGHREAHHTKPDGDTDHALVIACGPPASVPRILPEALRQVERYADLVGWSFTTTPRTRMIGSHD